MRNVALLGKARSGKDTAASLLVRQYRYTRLAFADPLKEMAIAVDPWIPTGYGVTVRLSRLIADTGWDYAKERHAEVRRFLQHLGQAQREHDEDYWVRALRSKVNAAQAWNLPVVVTDVRYPNEADMLRTRGFRMVRVVRPALRELPLQAARHASETALDDFRADVEIVNSGSVEELHRLMTGVVQ